MRNFNNLYTGVNSKIKQQDLSNWRSRISFTPATYRCPLSSWTDSTHAHWWRCALRWWPVSTQRSQYATGVPARPYGCDAFIQFVSTIIYGRPPTGNSGVHHRGQGISISFFLIKVVHFLYGTKLIVRYSFFELLKRSHYIQLLRFRLLLADECYVFLYSLWWHGLNELQWRIYLISVLTEYVEWMGMACYIIYEFGI